MLSEIIELVTDNWWFLIFFIGPIWSFIVDTLVSLLKWFERRSAKTWKQIQKENAPKGPTRGDLMCAFKESREQYGDDVASTVFHDMMSEIEDSKDFSITDFLARCEKEEYRKQRRHEWYGDDDGRNGEDSENVINTFELKEGNVSFKNLKEW